MTHVVITTLRPLENRGVEALAKSIVQGVIDTFDDLHITVLSNEPELARRALPQDCVHFVEDDAYGPANGIKPLRAFLRRLRRFIRRDVLGRHKASEKAFKDADIVLVSGGDVFSSTYGTTERYLWQLEYPISLGKPVLFFAQSIGLFDTKEEEESFAARGKKCYFTVREEISQAYLTEKLGVDPARITLTADPAFLMSPSGPEILDRYGLTGERFVTAAISRGISGFKGLSHADHVAAWVNAAHFILGSEALGDDGKLVLVPHVQPSETPDENDLYLAREIHERLDHDPRVVIMDGQDLSAQDFKTALSAAEFNIAERTHGAIGAMSMGVPTLSIGYSIKAEGILRQLIQNEELYAKSLVKVEQFTPDRAVDILREAWNVRADFAAALAETLPDIKRRAQLNYDIARRLMKP